MYRNQLRYTALILAVASITFFSFTSKVKATKKLSPPGAITDVTSSWLNIPPHCVIFGYLHTVVGGAGATSYNWEILTSSWVPYGGPGNNNASTSTFGDSSCDIVEMRVEAVNTDGSSGWYYFYTDYCPPFDGCSLKSSSKKIMTRK